jgi:hypothetical protein
MKSLRSKVLDESRRLLHAFLRPSRGQRLVPIPAGPAPSSRWYPASAGDARASRWSPQGRADQWQRRSLHRFTRDRR